MYVKPKDQSPEAQWLTGYARFTHSHDALPMPFVAHS